MCDSMNDCTHLVTDKVRRTVKFLCGVARGVPIVTQEWLEQSRKANAFIGILDFHKIFNLIIEHVCIIFGL